MNNHNLKQYDFEHPSRLFILEDRLKGLLGGPLLYRPYFKTLGLKGNENVLDFGCGGGAGSRHLVNLLTTGGHLVCLDASSYWIARARSRLKKYSNAECQSGDIRVMDIPDSSFDVISTIHVIHDIAPAERQGIIQALSRKLKTGGFFFVKEPIKKSHGIPVEELGALLSGAGFKVVEHRETGAEYIGKYVKTAQ